LQCRGSYVRAGLAAAEKTLHSVHDGWRIRHCCGRHVSQHAMVQGGECCQEGRFALFALLCLQLHRQVDKLLRVFVTRVHRLHVPAAGGHVCSHSSIDLRHGSGGKTAAVCVCLSQTVSEALQPVPCGWE
jgi:hypothetical protein